MAIDSFLKSHSGVYVIYLQFTFYDILLALIGPLIC